MNYVIFNIFWCHYNNFFKCCKFLKRGGWGLPICLYWPLLHIQIFITKSILQIIKQCLDRKPKKSSHFGKSSHKRLSDLPWTCLSLCLPVCLPVPPHLWNTGNGVKWFRGGGKVKARNEKQGVKRKVNEFHRFFHLKAQMSASGRCKWRRKAGLSNRSTCQWTCLPSIALPPLTLNFCFARVWSEERANEEEIVRRQNDNSSNH